MLKEQNIEDMELDLKVEENIMLSYDRENHWNYFPYDNHEN